MTAPTWHAENELITGVDATFGEVVMLNGTKSLKSITRLGVPHLTASGSTAHDRHRCADAPSG